MGGRKLTTKDFPFPEFVFLLSFYRIKMKVSVSVIPYQTPRSGLTTMETENLPRKLPHASSPKLNVF